MRILIAILLLFIAPQLMAQPLIKSEFDPAETRCNGSRADDEVIDRLLKDMDFVDQVLPNVPPEEQRYLEAEGDSALRVGQEEERAGNVGGPRASAMLDRLHARPLFYVWQVRKEIGPTRDALKRVLKRQPKPFQGKPDYITYNKNPEAEKLERAAAAMATVNSYQLAARDLMMAPPSGRAASFMTGQQYMRFVGMDYMTNDLARFMMCKLAKIMGKQTIEF